MGPCISLTFPPQMAVISRVTHPIHGSFSFTHLCSFLLSLTHSLAFSSTIALFYVSALDYFVLSVLPASLRLMSFLLSPHLLPFCTFLVVHHFFQPVFSYNYVSLKSYPSLLWSLLLNCLLVSVSASLYPTSAHCFSPAKPFHLSLSGIALSCDPCLSFRSALFISCSFSMLCLHTLSLFVFLSATLLCLATSRQGCWQRWARAYLKCHWQSDKRSYGK